MAEGAAHIDDEPGGEGEEGSPAGIGDGGDEDFAGQEWAIGAWVEDDPGAGGDSAGADGCSAKDFAGVARCGGREGSGAAAEPFGQEHVAVSFEFAAPLEDLAGEVASGDAIEGFGDFSVGEEEEVVGFADDAELEEAGLDCGQQPIAEAGGADEDGFGALAEGDPALGAREEPAEEPALEDAEALVDFAGEGEALGFLVCEDGGRRVCGVDIEVGGDHGDDGFRVPAPGFCCDLHFVEAAVSVALDEGGEAIEPGLGKVGGVGIEAGLAEELGDAGLAGDEGEFPEVEADAGALDAGEAGEEGGHAPLGFVAEDRADEGEDGVVAGACDAGDAEMDAGDSS